MVSSINIVRKQSQLSLVHLDMSECSSLDDTGLHMIVLNCQLMTHLYLRKCSNITGIYWFIFFRSQRHSDKDKELRAAVGGIY